MRGGFCLMLKSYVFFKKFIFSDAYFLKMLVIFATILCAALTKFYVNLDTEIVWLKDAALNFEIDIFVWGGFKKLANPTYLNSQTPAFGSTLFARLKADSHIPCRSPAMPFFLIWFTQWGRVWFKHTMAWYVWIGLMCESNTGLLCKSNGKDTI
jgi:hypothetical protein